MKPSFKSDWTNASDSADSEFLNSREDLVLSVTRVADRPDPPIAWRRQCQAGGRGKARCPPLFTVQQEEVAALAAIGFSNEQIARQLNVSQSAVSFHLRVIFRTLGIKRRGQIAVAWEAARRQSR